MDIKISPEEINKFIADAILQSSLGPSLDARVKEMVSKLSSSYDNPFDVLIKAHIHNEVGTILTRDYKEYIHSKIKEKLTDKMVDDLIEKLWGKLSKDY